MMMAIMSRNFLWMNGLVINNDNTDNLSKCEESIMWCLVMIPYYVWKKYCKLLSILRKCFRCDSYESKSRINLSSFYRNMAMIDWQLHFCKTNLLLLFST